MNITENKKSDSEIELVIELERSDIEKDLQKAAVKISKNINVPGFRPGQAPYDVVAKNVGGEAKIYEEALQDIVGNSLVRQIAERKLETIGQPKISIEKMVPGFGVTYKAVLSLMPKVELGDISKIKIKKAEAKVEDKDVEKVIDSMLQMRQKETAVKREAKTGDKVDIDFEIKRDGVPIEGGSAKNYKLVLGAGQFIPGFEENVVGLGQGSEKKFEVTFPESYHHKPLAGKKADVELKLNQVFELKKPALDDEFAKSMGGYESAQKLKEQVRQSLQAEKERETKEKRELLAMEELVTVSKIGQLTDMMVNEEIKKMVGELEHNVSGQGMKIDDYLKSIKKTREDLEKDFKPKAEHRLKVALVAREFGRQENIKIDDEQVDKEIEIAKKSYQNNPEMQAQLESKNYREYMRNMLTNKKVFQALAEKISS